MQSCCIQPERSLTNRGLPPTYQEYGERSAKPSVICIPGAFQAQRCFKHLYHALAMQGYHVIGDNADALAAFQVVSRIFDLHCSVYTRQEAFERFFQRLTARPLAPDEGYDRDVLLFLEKLS
jgi:hypothetical protein